MNWYVDAKGQIPDAKAVIEAPVFDNLMAPFNVRPSPPVVTPPSATSENIVK